MSDITVRFKSTTVDEVVIQGENRCSNCGSLMRKITTSHIVAASLVYAKKEQVQVTCANCGKKFQKKQWDENIAEIAAAKKQEFRTSFFQKYGTSLIAVLLVLGGVAFFLYQDHSEIQANKEAAMENFAKANGQDRKQVWYDNISPGDYLLSAKSYYDPARVYLVKEINSDTTVLVEYDQYFDHTQYKETDQLKSLDLGKGNTREILVKTSNIRRGHIEEISDNPMSVPSGYIEQIKKGS